MKILLISDTHGHLDIINQLAKKHQCNAVIHAGDLGFYDDHSVENLSEREIKLSIVHSNLDNKEKARILESSLSEQKAYIQNQMPLSDLQDYLIGNKKFNQPVYAVWGNHEDIDVLNKFYREEYQIENLNILHEKQSFHLDNLHIFGLGGNLLMTKKFLQQPLAGGGGKVWSTLSQYIELLETVEQNSKRNEKRVFVNHVSPGKEAFIRLMSAHLLCDFNVSGHMGAPYCMIWNDFAINTFEKSKANLQQCLDELSGLISKLPGKKADQYKIYLKRLRNLPEEKKHFGRNGKVPKWYVDTYYVNLPDASVGYGIMSVKKNDLIIRTYQ